MVHDTPVDGILSAVVKHACDLVIMGTHARTAAIAVIVAAAERHATGIVRTSDIPVLVVRGKRLAFPKERRC
jgi:nucleotide-binding universal stress UspA family protein